MISCLSFGTLFSFMLHFNKTLPALLLTNYARRYCYVFIYCGRVGIGFCSCKRIYFCDPLIICFCAVGKVIPVEGLTKGFTPIMEDVFIPVTVVPIPPGTFIPEI